MPEIFPEKGRIAAKTGGLEFLVTCNLLMQLASSNAVNHCCARLENRRFNARSFPGNPWFNLLCHRPVGILKSLVIGHEKPSWGVVNLAIL